MKLLICIDDTDNMESIGTGELLEIMGKEMAQRGLGRVGYITRHQLYVHPDIPYTSHNSSMCCEAEVAEENYQDALSFVIGFLIDNAAEGSDPGLCFMRPQELTAWETATLVEFGRRAKTEILTKEMANILAAHLPQRVHLSEHGGTGQGIIGALAGCGLRLSGSDGRMKGKIYPENEGNVMTVAHICRRYPFDAVREISGRYLEETERVMIGPELKGVYLNHQIVLLVKPNGSDLHVTCDKRELKAF